MHRYLFICYEYVGIEFAARNPPKRYVFYENNNLSSNRYEIGEWQISNPLLWCVVKTNPVQSRIR